MWIIEGKGGDAVTHAREECFALAAASPNWRRRTKLLKALLTIQELLIFTLKRHVHGGQCHTACCQQENECKQDAVELRAESDHRSVPNRPMLGRRASQL